MKVQIKLTDYWSKCGDGCCDHFGTITTVNGEQLDNHNQDVDSILQKVLEHLGYEVEIVHEYE